MKLNLPIFVRNFNEFLKKLLFYAKHINKILSNLTPVNYQINMHIIRMICKKEKLSFIVETNAKEINILMLYILNFSLFFYLYKKIRRPRTKENKIKKIE